MSLFFILKSARQDLRYILNYDGAIGVLTTILFRVVIKSVADFTAIMHFRHAYELGGAYFTLNLFVNQALCFVAVFYYNQFYDGGNTVNGDVLWSFIACASILFFSK